MYILYKDTPKAIWRVNGEGLFPTASEAPFVGPLGGPPVWLDRVDAIAIVGLPTRHPKRQPLALGI